MGLKILFLSLAVLIGTMAFTLSGCFNQSVNSQTNPFDGIIRLHIMANSNTRDDINLKLQVRDSVLNFLDNELDGVTSVAVAKRYINSNLATIEAVATSTLLRGRAGYRATARFKVTYFPQITYALGMLQAGYYNALVIELGNSNGSNWWCVIYPPLCFLPSTAQDGYSGFRYRSFIWDRIVGVG